MPPSYDNFGPAKPFIIKSDVPEIGSKMIITKRNGVDAAIRSKIPEIGSIGMLNPGMSPRMISGGGWSIVTDPCYIWLNRVAVCVGTITQSPDLWTGTKLYGDGESAKVSQCGYFYNGYLSIMFFASSIIIPYAVFEIRKCKTGLPYLFIETYGKIAATTFPYSLWFNQSGSASTDWVLLASCESGILPYAETRFTFKESKASAIATKLGCCEKCINCKCLICSDTFWQNCYCLFSTTRNYMVPPPVLADSGHTEGVGAWARRHMPYGKYHREMEHTVEFDTSNNGTYKTYIEYKLTGDGILIHYGYNGDDFPSKPSYLYYRQKYHYIDAYGNPMAGYTEHLLTQGLHPALYPTRPGIQMGTGDVEYPFNYAELCGFVDIEHRQNNIGDLTSYTAPYGCRIVVTWTTINDTIWNTTDPYDPYWGRLRSDRMISPYGPPTYPKEPATDPNNYNSLNEPTLAPCSMGSLYNDGDFYEDSYRHVGSGEWGTLELYVEWKIDSVDKTITIWTGNDPTSTNPNGVQRWIWYLDDNSHWHLLNFGGEQFNIMQDSVTTLPYDPLLHMPALQWADAILNRP